MAGILIDIGNTSSKIAFSQNNRIESIYKCDEIDFNHLQSIAKKRKIDSIAVSDVTGKDTQFYDKLKNISSNLIRVNSNIRLPFINLYDSPLTLGADRICAVSGVKELFPKKNCIIFDLGTAITIDFLNKKGEYEGGNISLGMRSRFRAINQYTSQLPLLSPLDDIQAKGNSTNSAIEAGVILGIMFEIEGYIKKYPRHICVFTGGDSIFFATKMKNPIFVVYNLVLKGLSQIANINE